MLLAYGRNRPAEAAFLEEAAKRFSIETLADEELHEARAAHHTHHILRSSRMRHADARCALQTYQCLDVSVLRLRLLRGDGDDAVARAEA